MKLHLFIIRHFWAMQLLWEVQLPYPLSACKHMCRFSIDSIPTTPTTKPIDGAELVKQREAPAKVLLIFTLDNHLLPLIPTTINLLFVRNRIFTIPNFKQTNYQMAWDKLSVKQSKYMNKYKYLKQKKIWIMINHNWYRTFVAINGTQCVRTHFDSRMMLMWMFFIIIQICLLLCNSCGYVIIHITYYARIFHG